MIAQVAALLPLCDVQNQLENRRVPIDRGGVSDLRYPTTVLDQLQQPQRTTATLKRVSALGKRLPVRIDDAATLARHAAAIEADRNEAGNGCDWRFTTADARIKLASLYPAIQER